MNSPLTPSVLHAQLNATPAIRILDVRSPAEFENAHIRGAYNVPLHLLSEHTADIRAAGDHPAVLVCQSGQRAATADELLRNAGMSSLRVLAGGMHAWRQAGLPIERIRARVSLERQVRMLAGSLVAVGALAALVVNPAWAVVPMLVGSGLVFAGLTDTCGMALLLARLPYNRASATCDTEVMVRRFLSEARH